MRVSGRKLIGVGVVAFIVAIPVGLWAFVQIEFPNYSHRFRLTVEIDAPDGLHAASSVIQATRLDRRWLPLPGRAFEIEVQGEAVFVDLGGGRNVVALLALGPRGDDTDRFGMLALDAWNGDRSSEGWRTVGARRGSVELTERLIPTLVTFSDLADPKSAQLLCVAADRTIRKRVTPAQCGTEGAASSSDVPAGLSLRAVRLEMTRDPATHAIATKLPWLPHPGYLSGQFGCAPIEPHCLYGGHLTRSS